MDLPAYPVPEADHPGPVREDLITAVREAEAALADDDLAARLEDPAFTLRLGAWIRDLYVRYLDDPPAAVPGFRHNAVGTCLELFGERLAPPRKTFPAEPAPDGAVRVGETVIPPSVALASRFWGFDYDLPDEGTRAAHAKAQIREATRRLASDLDAVRKLESWLADRERIRGELAVGGTRTGRELEHLVHDALALAGHTVRPASLEEDVREATDLRVRLAGGPSRGQRLQVTWTARPERVALKGGRSRSGRRARVVSPLTLAETLLDGPAAPYEAVLTALDARPLGVEQLAGHLRDALRESIARSTEDPRGPAGVLPAPVAELLVATAADQSRAG